MVNVISVPQRFKDGIGKARDQNVLHCFFTQIMVNTIDLFLVQGFVDLFIQVARRLQISAKWLFDDDTSPALVFLELTCLRKLVNDVRKNSRWRCHVINAVSRTSLPILQQTIKFFEIWWIIITTLMISKVRCKVIPLFIRVLKRS